MNFEQWLQANGFDPLVLGQGQTDKLRLAWRAETQPPPVAAVADRDGNPQPLPAPPAVKPTTPTSFDQEMAAIEAETARRETILAMTRRACEGHVGDREAVQRLRALGEESVADQGCDVKTFELRLLRADRFAGPAVFARSEPEAGDAVLEAALCKAGGLANRERHFDERTLDAADRQFRSGLGLGDLLMTFARRAGHRGTSVRGDLKGVLRAAFNDVNEGPMAAGSWGPSTGGGISGILSNTANKFLKEGFMAVDSAWREISAIRSFTDFKTVTTYTMIGGLTYDKLAPGGEIKHGQLGSETYTNQLDTYAKMIGLDRRDLINDDLGALTGVSRRLGRGAATKLNDIFWTAFLNNSSFFTSGRGNVSTGAGSALAIAGLDAAFQKFLTQTDTDGNPVSIMPRILLVPPALYATARQLVDSMALNQQPASNAAAGTTNPWAGMFRVVSSPYMQNSSYTGYSAAAWYLLADPNDVPVIEVAFLNGNQEPIIETADADFGQLGIALRGYFDAGVGLQEYRAGVRSAGS